MVVASLASHSRLGRYEIVRPLGRGGAGEVFLARSPGPEGFERSFALKVLRPGAGARAALIEEAKLLQGVHHSNVVQVFELGREGELDFVAMEFIDGLSLDDVITRAPRRGPVLAPGLALYVGAEICKALHFVHGCMAADGRPLGLVHRDVSPSNILLSWQGEVKLADFGIAKGADAPDRPIGATEPGVVKGKLGYMAPEHAAGGVALDGRADLYALAVSLFEAMTGENPLLGSSELDTYHRCLEPSFPAPSQALKTLPSDEGRALDAFFARALARSRDQRFANAAEMRRAIEELPTFRAQTTPDLGLAAELARVKERGPAPSRSLSKAARLALGGAPTERSPAGGPATALVSRSTGGRLKRLVLGGAAVAGVALVAWLVTRGGVEGPSGTSAGTTASTGLDRGAGPSPPSGGRHAPPPLAGRASPPAAVAPSSPPSARVVPAAQLAAEVPAKAPPGGTTTTTATTATSEAPRPPRAADNGRRAKARPAAPADAAPVPASVVREAPVAGAPATLRVNLDPWAEIFVDGKARGATPQANLELPAGRHTLKLRNPEAHLEKTLPLTLAPGETRTISEWPP